MTIINYTANNDSKKTIGGVTETHTDKFRKGGKYYQINRTGLYPLLQVCCMGKCNTYWRTIGRYPEIHDFDWAGYHKHVANRRN